MQSGLKPLWKASTGGGEYHSSCPACGGIDRFYIQPHRAMNKCNGFYSCRQCGIAGDSIEFARQFLNLSFQDAAQTVNATISNNIPLLIPKKYNSRIATLIEPPAQWIIQATNFLEEAHKQLLMQKDVIDTLSSRGISLDTIQQYKFGWSSKDHFFSKSDWGLTEQKSSNEQSGKLWIPKGLVIPINKLNGQIIRLKVRRPDWKQDDKFPKYVVISGSMNGLNIIGNPKHNAMIIVESELDAYAINQVAHDFVCAVAVGSNIKNPDNVTDYLAKKSSNLLICHDNDEAGKKMLDKWRSLYPHAKAYSTPSGKDIGEIIQTRFNLREWLLQATSD
jgi:DNA primase